MRPARIASSAAFLFFIFVVQEAAISRINFPIAGYSLYIAVLMGLLAMEDRSAAVMIGFFGGVILDLSPSIDAPFGQWAFVMTIMGYIFAANRESIGDFSTRPAALVLFVSLGATVSLLIFLSIGALLGESDGNFQRILTTSLGNGLWTLLFSPIILPLLSRFRHLSLTSRERK